MKYNEKTILQEAFTAPPPKRKEEFFKNRAQTSISTASFMKMQIAYIRKRVWVMSALVFVCAALGVEFAGQDCVWVVAALMPFIALCTVTESARSVTYGMAELEMASRFSLKSILLARLGAIGLMHAAILCLLIPFVGNQASVPLTQIGVYWLVPYLLTSVLGLMAVRKVHGKEAVYICMGIAAVVSYLNFILKEILPQLYEEKQLLWWIAAGIYLLAKVLKEYKKALYETEELAWN